MSHSGVSPFGVEPLSVMSLLYVEFHSEFSIFSVQSIQFSILSSVHSGLSLFGVEYIQGRVYSGFSPFGVQFRWGLGPFGVQSHSNKSPILGSVGESYGILSPEYFDEITVWFSAFLFHSVA